MQESGCREPEMRELSPHPPYVTGRIFDGELPAPFAGFAFIRVVLLGSWDRCRATGLNLSASRPPRESPGRRQVGLGGLLGTPFALRKHCDSEMVWSQRVGRGYASARLIQKGAF